MNAARAFKGIAAACVLAAVLAAAAPAASTAKSCSAQYGTCFSMCAKYGFGRRRIDHPHPQSAAACRDHCIGWKAACLKSGCWNGDLVAFCGLARR